MNFGMAEKMISILEFENLPSVFPCRIETPMTLIPFAPQFTAVCLEVLV